MSDRPDERIPGLHHVTSIAGSGSANLEFYTDVLSLRRVKSTVNFDDPATRHLYYGNRAGEPGTALTFFPFEHGQEGRVGRGQVTATAFAVPEGAVGRWRERFDQLEVEHDEPVERFGERVLPFRDHDGHRMEIVESETDVEPWAEGEVSEGAAIRGFRGVTIVSRAPESTADVLRELGFEETAEEGDRTRFRSGGARGNAVDLHRPKEVSPGRPGAGTVHHIAFRTCDEETQRAWRSYLIEMGMNVTEQKDRHYFKSIYFREPGGVLFEIATEGPGFTRDEPVEELGDTLTLPPRLESDRAAIEGQLPEL
ncbi:MAG: ring-cleaving dioxygenase [Bradymonadaceae bacterium]